MKKTKLIGFALLAIVIGVVGFYACEKTYVEPEAPVEILESPKLVLAPGIWKISSFQWKNKEPNTHFDSYMFIFNKNGTIEAIHGNIKQYGKYTKRENILGIRFLEQPLTELNNGWEIIDHTSSSLALKGLSPEDHSSQYLEFEKVNVIAGESVE